MRGVGVNQGEGAEGHRRDNADPLSMFEYLSPHEYLREYVMISRSIDVSMAPMFVYKADADLQSIAMYKSLVIGQRRLLVIGLTAHRRSQGVQWVQMHPQRE